jgi:hypothetical protein
MSEVKKTVIEEALIDFDTVLKEAQEIAKEKLATSMPDKFESLVEQHLKTKNKINESDEEQEPVMADEKESVKESTPDESQEMSETSEKVDMSQATIAEIEEAYDNLSLDEIEIMREAEGDDDIEVKDVEKEIDAMSEMVDELDAQDQPMVAEENNDPYSKLKQMHEEMSKMLEAIESDKADSQLRETFKSKMKGVYGESFEEAFGVDECGKMFETFKKLQEGKEFPKSSPTAKPADEKIVKGGTNKGHNLATAKKGAVHKTSTPKTSNPAEETLAETELPKTSPTAQPAEEKLVGGGMNKGHNLAKSKSAGSAYSKAVPKSALPSKETLAEVEETSEGETIAEEQVEEGHGVALSHNKHVGQESLPRIDQGKEYAKDKVRIALQKESEDRAKRINNLLKEQKDLTKKVNQFKKEKIDLVSINEGFKKTLNEMKDQMKKMAVFNTNIAHVNNLLVNEEFALTKDEKIYIIEKFKKVASITESDATHKVLINEFKTSKKKIDESIEKKITENVGGESSANILESKIVEKTAFEKQVSKMKDIINYGEKRRK